MRLLADENIPKTLVTALQSGGHDVAWVPDVIPGTDETAILAFEQQEQRTLLTFDKDFGELAFKSKLPAQAGIILLRFDVQSPDVTTRTIITALGLREKWGGFFSVIEADRVRLTPLESEN